MLYSSLSFSSPHYGKLSSFWLSLGLLILQPNAVAANSTSDLIKFAERIPEAQMLPRLIPVTELARLGYSKPFIVQGTTVFTSGSILVASEIVFQQGSKLVLAPAMTPIGREQSVYLIARRIVVEPGPLPAVVSWAGSANTFISPVPAGKASPGAAGYDGSPGAVGSSGTNGNSGTAGRTPPILFLATREIVGGQLLIDWRGQDGGPGGAGQDGGDGGPGGNGSPASSSLFDCRRGPGDGGKGGNGGNGGSGGIGGRGGDGGQFVLLALPTEVATVGDKIRLDVSPGTGGPNGAGGGPGKGGAGGERGRAAPPFCRDDAKPGGPGQPGKTGGAPIGEAPGASGLKGAAAVGELNDIQARAIGILE